MTINPQSDNSASLPPPLTKSKAVSETPTRTQKPVLLPFPECHSIKYHEWHLADIAKEFKMSESEWAIFDKQVWVVLQKWTDGRWRISEMRQLLPLRNMKDERGRTFRWTDYIMFVRTLWTDVSKQMHHYYLIGSSTTRQHPSSIKCKNETF